MLVQWLKRLAVSAVVEDINSNGRVRRALRETERVSVSMSSITPESFSKLCQEDAARLKSTVSITADEIRIRPPEVVLRNENSVR